MTVFRARGDRMAAPVTWQPFLYQPPPCADGEACGMCVRWLTPVEFAAVDARLSGAPPQLPPAPPDVCVTCGAALWPPRRSGARPTCGAACRAADYRARRNVPWGPVLPPHLTAEALRQLAPNDPDREPYKYAARPGESHGAFAARMGAQHAVRIS